MSFDLRAQQFNKLLGGVEMRIVKDIKQTLVAELLTFFVLRLIQSVGIDEERLALDGFHFFIRVFHPRQNAYRCIGEHIQELDTVSATSDDRRIMTCITEREVTCSEIYESESEGHEHIGLVVVARQGIIHTGADFSWAHRLLGQREEQTRGLCHKQRGRHPLATDVTHTEIELVV